MKVYNHLLSLVGDIVEITDEKHDDHVEDDFEDAGEIPDYNINNKANPPLFAEFIDNAANDELEYCLKRDIIWAIAVDIEEENEEHVIGSWADFNIQVTEETNVRKCLLEHLQTIPQSLEYPVCKRFLDLLLKVMRHLEHIQHIDHILTHGDKLMLD